MTEWCFTIGESRGDHPPCTGKRSIQSGAQTFATQLIHLGEIEGGEGVHTEGLLQQVVGELGIAGQRRTVHVGAQHRTLDHALETIAGPFNHEIARAAGRLDLPPGTPEET